MSHWSATLDLSPAAVLVVMRDAEGKTRLKARLPDPPRHPRALMTLLESMALWSAEPLCVAIFVADHAVPSPGSPDGPIAWPEENPLVQFHFLERWGRGGGLKGETDLRRLGLLR
jgi:hypothetical protein